MDAIYEALGCFLFCHFAKTFSSLRKEEFRVDFVQGACVWQMATVCLETECLDLCTGVCTHTHVYICTFTMLQNVCSIYSVKTRTLALRRIEVSRYS